MSWFNIQGIREEIRKIQWPSRKDMTNYTATVLGFVIFFAIYFLFAEVIISYILRLLKVF